jgi:hypothetical protein
MGTDRRNRLVRLLRIAASVVCLTMCVLLVALWVRSCLRFDQIIHRTSATEYVALTTARGQVAFGGDNDAILANVFKRDWMHRGFSMKGVNNKTGSPIAVFPVNLPNSAILLLPHFHSPFVASRNGSTSYELSLPYWLLVLTSAAFGAIPWIHWRFSVRTLLIATTLVAVMLGLIVYAAR